ncbi:hypothetical protein [Streptomyces botrytidirepellens]|uniref:hypothetical protein n=1 Tax=Streptomyces botrytidirepellens TaxID=2486417 RepID=UPI0016159E55|nr:hypothetical protein [Streptomyces botrytidirepellens]
MYGDHVHHLLHRLRAEQLRREAAHRHRRTQLLRTRLGWRLVEVGLRLATPPGPVTS